MLKKIWSSGLLFFLFFLISTPTQACVGRILYVGAVDNPEERLMAEMLVLLINERTGTSVKIRYFDDRKEIYTALKSNIEKDRVDIVVENTADAAELLNISLQSDLNADYTSLKKRYDQDFSIIWLNPFGFTNNNASTEQSISAPLVRRDVLTNFPLLPRVLNKLSGAINNDAYFTLLKKVKSGKKHKNVARDFLQDKKFI